MVEENAPFVKLILQLFLFPDFFRKGIIVGKDIRSFSAYGFPKT